MYTDAQKRISVLMICFLITSSVFVVRLAWLQLFKARELARVASQSHSRTVFVEWGHGNSGRGQIADRNLNMFTGANQRPGLAVFTKIGKQEETDADYAHWLAWLESKTGLDSAEIAERSHSRMPLPLIEPLASKENLPHWIKPVTWDWDDDLNFRRYSYSPLACHVLGIVNDNKGILGLERMYESYLQCQRPGVAAFTTAGNRLIPGLGYREIGANAPVLVTTLDLGIQETVERIWDQYIDAGQVPPTGALLVLDPKTGEILAMASRPVIFGPEHQHNRAVRKSPKVSTLPPASVIKVLTAAVALEQKPTFQQPLYTCNGSVTYGANRFECHQVHGELDLAGALSHSCNVYFAQLANETGAKPLLDMALSLGFGDPLISELPAIEVEPGRVPSPEDLATAAGIVNHFALGANKFELTPLHVAVLMAAVANGGFQVGPRLIIGLTENEEVPSPVKPRRHRVFTASTARILANMLNQAVVDREGLYDLSAYPLARSLAAKTGTSDSLAPENYEVRWNAGFFPVESPRYVVVYMAEVPPGWLVVSRERLLAEITDAILRRE